MLLQVFTNHSDDKIFEEAGILANNRLQIFFKKWAYEIKELGVVVIYISQLELHARSFLFYEYIKIRIYFCD